MNGIFTDEKTGISYTKQGGYYLPNLNILAEEEKEVVGIWGRRHLRYIQEHKKIFYINLLTSEKLDGYLAGVDKQAEAFSFRLVKQMAECEGIIEALKAENPMEWVGRMNNIRSRVEEIVNEELIFV